MRNNEVSQAGYGVRTSNGQLIHPWWSNAVVYQIYPRSFQDTNNDGFGDLKGITSRLDYLADLGVDVLWLSPVYRSPQDDNGYDISDYEDIDPMFGSMADMDELLKQAHTRGLKIVMDLVVNHTSDEHAWFQASRDKNDPHADWYWWRPARSGHTPGTPGAEPNNWGSSFGGSAWQYDEKRGEYYLHLFSPKQPDLNWENPEVRKAVYAMMNRWLDRGIDGFRMDVINLISKHMHTDGSLPDSEPGPSGYSDAWQWCSDGPRLDEFLKEMHREVFDGREGYLTVGEAPGVSAQRASMITDPDNHELDMLFLIDHMAVDEAGPAGKWSLIPLRLPALKDALIRQQTALQVAGWPSLFWGNHDQPRIVSRFGDDSTQDLRVRSAKALALLLHMHRGTPYIYQGEELGMTNAGFTKLEQYKDVESLNLYEQYVSSHVMSSEQMMSALQAKSRDNARTPMQWDASQFAGFMSPESQHEPWIEVNPNKNEINAAAQVDDPQSIYAFYQQLITLRHHNTVVDFAEVKLLDHDDERVYSFIRIPQDVSDTRRILIVVNMSSEQALIPEQTQKVLREIELTQGILPHNILLGNDEDAVLARQLQSGVLQPWSACAYEYEEQVQLSMEEK